MHVVEKFTKLKGIEESIEKIGKFNKDDQCILLEFLRTTGMHKGAYEKVLMSENREDMLSLAKEILENEDNFNSFYEIYRGYLDIDRNKNFYKFFIEDLFNYKREIEKTIKNGVVPTDFQAIACHISDNNVCDVDIMSENAELLVLVREVEKRGYFTALKNYEYNISQAELEVQFNIDKFFNEGIINKTQYLFLKDAAESNALYLEVVSPETGESDLVYAQKDMTLTREVNICMELNEIVKRWKIDMKKLIFKY